MDMKQNIFRIIILIICLIFLSILLLNIDKITNNITKLYLKQHDIVIPETDDYYLGRNFSYLKTPESYTPYSYKDLINIFYSIIDHGWTEFTFYCPDEYDSCLEDAKAISKDKDLLTHINNFVHPFHSADNMITTLRTNGEVYIVVEYLYSKEDITVINNEVDRLYKSIVTTKMTTDEKILAIHDYIINNTKYDIIKSSSKTSTHHSNIAYGPLFEGYATCNGYTDLMTLFLYKLNIPNYKVAKTPDNTIGFEGHVWNAVYLNNNWLHLDLTWDDPVSKDGKNYLQHNYYLITTEELNGLDEPQKIIDHQFPKNIYIELK